MSLKQKKQAVNFPCFSLFEGNALFKHLASKCDPLAAKAKETKETTGEIRDWERRLNYAAPETNS